MGPREYIIGKERSDAPRSDRVFSWWRSVPYRWQSLSLPDYVRAARHSGGTESNDGRPQSLVENWYLNLGAMP